MRGRDPEGRSGARRAISAVVAIVAAAGALVLPTGAVEAADGYALEASTVYHLDPAVPTVTVHSTYRMTNTSPDRNVGGGRIEFYYYSGLRVPVDDPVTGLTVTVNGRSAQYEQHDVDGVPALDVTFNSRLRYGNTYTIDVTYQLAGSAPRTDDSFTRVNPAYMSFVVFTYADEGKGDVRVEVPADWTTDWVGSDFGDIRDEGGTQVYEALDIAVPDDFYVLFTARQDDRLDSKKVTVGGSTFEIRSWPGDDGWQTFTEQHVVDGVPVLERLVGTAWPEAAETDVIEASTPYLRGYAGFYNADDDVIEVGEELDSHTMLHELSHAWFNDDYISERWLSEGLADEIGARAVEALGEPLPAPSDYDDPSDPVEVDPFPLNTWGEPFALDDAEEYYGYRTSFLVLRELRKEIGEQKMIELVGSLLATERAYRAEGSEELAGDAIDWREFLDLAEQVGGSAKIEQLYRDYVVTDQQAEQLDTRDDTLPVYEALVDRGATWAPPVAVRSAMAQWRFDDAVDEIDAASAVLDTRDELSDTLDPLGLEPAGPLEQAYQDAKEIDAVATAADDQLAAAGRLVTAQGELDASLTSIDLDVPALDQAAYDAAPVAIADDTEALAAQAADVVAAHDDLDATLEPHGLAIPDLAADAFVESPEATLAQLAAEQEAADAVAGALDQRDDSQSLLQRLGAIGGDVDADLDRAAAALADGDLDAATASASDASDGIDTWRDRGVARLVAAGLGLVIGLLLVLLVSRLRRRRRAAAATETAPADAADAEHLATLAELDAAIASTATSTPSTPAAPWPAPPPAAPDASPEPDGDADQA